MGWKQLLASPSPTTAWSLEPCLAVAVRRDRRDGLRCASAQLPEGVVEVGAVGLQSVDRRRLAEALGPIQTELGGARRAAVVLPTGWVRVHLLEFDHLPRRAAELEEIVRWRLKKLLPVLPAELRVSALPHSAGGRKQVLCMSGLERAFAELEGAFADIGVEPGLVGPRLLVMAERAATRPGHQLVVQLEAGFLSLLLATDGAPGLLRTKPLPTGADPWPLATSELQLALAYMRDTLAVTAPLEVEVAAADAATERALADWWRDQEGAVVRTRLLPPCSGLASGVDPQQLAPVHAVLEVDRS